MVSYRTLRGKLVDIFKPVLSSVEDTVKAIGFVANSLNTIPYRSEMPWIIYQSYITEKLKFYVMGSGPTEADDFQSNAKAVPAAGGRLATPPKGKRPEINSCSVMNNN